MSIKFSIFLSLLFLLFFGEVHAFETPELVKIKEWKLEKISGGVLVLSCKAVFYNPNKVKAKLKGVDLNVFLGETKAGQINQADKLVRIKKKQAFEIPLSIAFSPETNAKGYFSGFLTVFSLNDFVITLRGQLHVKAMGINVRIPVDESEELNLKQLIID